MNKRTITIQALSTKQVFWIILSVIIAVIPHLPRLPIWFPILLVLTVALRWLAAMGRVKPLPSFFLGLLTLSVFFAIIYFQGLVLNREISVTVLTTMTVLKLFETWRKRDAWMVVTLCYFVILTRYFYSQDMLLIFYLIASVFIITHALFVLQHSQTQRILHSHELKQTAGLLSLGLPLAALLFLFFPRLGSPIWGSPDFFGEGVTGISDSMTPGSISQMFSDDSTAFRVVFADLIPNNVDMYWRGPVLWDFDGDTWTRKKHIGFAQKPKDFVDLGVNIKYQVELEPTGQNYLFALDYPLAAPLGAILFSDSQLLSHDKVNQLRHYKLQSVLTQYNPYELLSQADIGRLKALPKGYNPKTLALIQDWKRQNLSAEQMIAKALNLFRNEEFYYSYSPPLLQGNTVDQFLFQTRSGFCEHYASAFTVMMRAAGLPARIVTGYQGGIFNQDYLLVKQSDAHAWSEVWIQNKGWIRVDPTAAVSPLRVEYGAQALMSEKSRSWLDSGWLRKMGENYDGLRYKWNQWVRDYNAVKQKALFEVFGFDSKDGKAIAIVLGVIMVFTGLVVLAFLFVTRPKRRLLAYDKEYNHYLRIFAKQGLIKPEAVGVIEFSQTVIAAYPNLKIPIDKFTQLYVQLRFSSTIKNRGVLDTKMREMLVKIAQGVKMKSKSDNKIK